MRGGHVTVENVCNIMMNTSRSYDDRLYHVRWLAHHRAYTLLSSWPETLKHKKNTDIAHCKLGGFDN